MDAPVQWRSFGISISEKKFVPLPKPVSPEEERDAEIRRAVLAALRSMDGTVAGDKVDLTTVRRRLGRGRGWAVRLMRGVGRGSVIIYDCRRPTEEEAEHAYLVVMRTLAATPGFGGIIETSDDDLTITTEMLEGDI